MTFDEISELWKSQPEQTLRLDQDQLIQTLGQEYRRQNRLLAYLNLQEVIPAVFLFCLFGWWGLQGDSASWALLTAAWLCLGVGMFLMASTVWQRVRETKFGDSVRDEIRRSLSQVKHREWLCRNILWWYLLPFVLAWNAVMLSSDSGAYQELQQNVWLVVLLALYVILCVALIVFVYRANRHIAVTRYAPRREQLECMLRAIDSDEEPDQG